MNEAARDELLIRLDERTGTMIERLKQGDQVMANLETRINSLESCEDQRQGTLKFAGIVAGIISTGGVVVSILVSYFRGGA
ncbi:MAG: hypothetical protein LUQ50_06390 [Methanospirillum sp.]|uniref:hypothetical protein n=1 Tax=Methanospirillum sp. TaxID=45200 RepID=UPI002372302A|nr:hypothetical protein [Methanospirillum sp.]MDD1728682.1 hypothetical protein [Methanospirillum sp.]